MPRYRARAYFNNHLGFWDKPRPDEDELCRRAEDHLPALTGYRVGDPLHPSAIILDIDAPGPEDACEEVFRQLNQDKRPNRKIEPSLSVGDLVALEAEGEGVVFAWFAVEMPVGFRRVEQPQGLPAGSMAG